MLGCSDLSPFQFLDVTSSDILLFILDFDQWTSSPNSVTVTEFPFYVDSNCESALIKFISAKFSLLFAFITKNIYIIFVGKIIFPLFLGLIYTLEVVT